MSVAEADKDKLAQARAQAPSGEFSDGQKIDPKEEEKMREEIRRANEEALVAKEQLISASLHQKPITPEYAKLLGAIHSVTFMTGSVADYRKVVAALSLRESLAQGEIGKKKIAYLASYTDWHFAVALGARNIDMVDTEYSKPELVGELMKSIKEFDPQAKLQKGPSSTINFKINLGEKPEDVSLTLVAEDITTYEPRGELGGVIEILGSTKRYTDGSSPVLPKVAKHLPNGALVLNFDFYQEQRASVPGLESLGSEMFNVHRVADAGKFQAIATKSLLKPA